MEVEELYCSSLLRRQLALGKNAAALRLVVLLAANGRARADAVLVLPHSWQRGPQRARGYADVTHPREHAEPYAT